MSEIFSKKKVKTLDIETEMCFCQSDTRRTSTWGRGWRTTDGSRGWKVWIYGGFVARCVHQSGAAYSPGGGSPSLSPLTHTAHTSTVEGRRKKKHEQKEMAEAEPETSAVVAPLQVFLSSTPPQQQQTRTRKTIVFFSKSARWLCLHNI